MSNMFQNKIYWMDDTDLWASRAKLAAAKKKYAECDWIRFRDDMYENLEAAFKDYVGNFITPPIFTPGKVIYCHGIPLKKQAGEYHQTLAKQFESIADNVCVMIIARPDKGSSIYKAAKKLGKADEAFELTQTNAIDWITLQAKMIGLTIDKTSCKMLADTTDFTPAKIQNELEKLKSLATDGSISPRLVEMTSFGEGHTDVKELGDLILKDEGKSAHEYLQRLLDRGEPALKICGFLQDWINRLAIAQSAGCNFEAIRSDVAELKKWESSDKKDKHGNALHEVVDDDKWGHYVRRDGETVAMFSNANSLYFSCKNLRDASKPPNWAYDGLLKMYKLQLRLREGDDEAKAMHEFIFEMMRK